MFVRLGKDSTFTGELYKVQFINGVSQEHVGADTFDKLLRQLGLEPEYIPEECAKCKEKDEDIKKLLEQIAKLKKGKA